LADHVVTSATVSEAGKDTEPKGYVRTYRVTAAVLWTVVILALCWMPRQVVHKVEQQSSWFEIHHFDKAVHCGIFVILSVLWARVWPAWQRYAWVSLIALALAAISELGQLIPAVGRDANFADGATDMLGCVIGLAIFPLVEPFLLSIETRIFSRSYS
jgi:VanZ family protein